MSALADGLFIYIGLVVTITFSQLFILLGPGLLLAALMQLVNRMSAMQAISLLGYWGYVYLFGWLGIPVHEIGHFIFAKLFGFQVDHLVLFNPNRYGTAEGSVRFRINGCNPIQRVGLFFTGIGPIVLGSGLIFAAAYFLLGSDVALAMDEAAVGSTAVRSLENLQALAGQIWSGASVVLGSLVRVENFTNWKFYLFVYIAFSIGSNITLSGSDIRIIISGFSAILGLLVTFNILTAWIGDFTLGYLAAFSRYYSFFYAIMALVIVINLVAALVLLPLGVMARTLREG